MNDQTPFDQATKAALDARAEALDGATLSRLRQARAAAIEQGRKRRHHWLNLWLPAAGAVAAAAIIGINVWHGQPGNGTPPDLALLESLASDSVHTPANQPDLDFIEWLARSRNAA